MILHKRELLIGFRDSIAVLMGYMVLGFSFGFCGYAISSNLDYKLDFYDFFYYNGIKYVKTQVIIWKN